VRLALNDGRDLAHVTFNCVTRLAVFDVLVGDGKNCADCDSTVYGLLFPYVRKAYDLCDSSVYRAARRSVAKRFRLSVAASLRQQCLRHAPGRIRMG